MAILRTYSATTAQLGPQAQWRFDEAGGAVAVDSADGLNGEYNGSVTFGFTPLAELAGVSGVNLNQLVADGNLELT